MKNVNAKMSERLAINELEIGAVYKDDEKRFFKISYDYDGIDSPRDQAGVKMTTFYTWIRGYESPDTCLKDFDGFLEEFGAGDMSDLLKKMSDKGYYVKPVYALIHSGIHYSLTPFHDTFDCGLAGVIFCEKNEGIYTEQMLDHIMEDEVSKYDAWVNGERYVAERLESDGDVVSVSWPFYGRTTEEWLEELKEALKCCGIKLQQNGYEKAVSKVSFD